MTEDNKSWDNFFGKHTHSGVCFDHHNPPLGTKAELKMKTALEEIIALGLCKAGSSAMVKIAQKTLKELYDTKQ